MNQELEEGLISIAAPLTNRRQTVAALNISAQANCTSAGDAANLLPPAARGKTISAPDAPRR